MIGILFTICIIVATISQWVMAGVNDANELMDDE